MKRWFWSILMVAAAVAALTVGASAKLYTSEDVAASTSPNLLEIDGVVYDITSSSDGKVVGYTKNLKNPVFILGEIKRPKASGTGTDSYTVTTIDEGAFRDCEVLSFKRVVIPANVTKVDEYAFYGCTSLDSVLFLGSEADGKDYNIEKGAFSGCGITELILPAGLKKIGTSAFATNNLDAVIIPYGVTKIENSAFSPCEDGAIQAVYLPDTLKSNPIDDTVFAGAAFWTSSEVIHFSGTEVTGPNGQKSIDLSTYRQIFKAAAIPTNWSISNGNIHRASYTQNGVSPTCVKTGLAQHGAPCLDYNNYKEKDCKYNLLKLRTINFDSLPHSYPELKDSDMDKIANMKPTPDYTLVSKCDGWTGTLELTCARCGEKGETEKTIAGTGHVWDQQKDSDGKPLFDTDGNPLFVEYTREGEGESEEATCEKEGFENIYKKCTICGKMELIEKRTIEKVPHNYTSTNTAEWGVVRNLINADCDSEDPRVYDFILPVCTMCEKPPVITNCADCTRFLALIEDPKRDPNYDNNPKTSWDWADEYTQHIFDEISGSTADPAHEELQNETLANCVTTVNNLRRETTAGHNFVMPNSPQEVYEGNCSLDELIITRRQCTKCGVIEGIWMTIDKDGNFVEGKSRGISNNTNSGNFGDYECEECEDLFDKFIAAKKAFDGLLNPSSTDCIPYNIAINNYYNHIKDRTAHTKADPDVNVEEKLPLEYTFTKAGEDHLKDKHFPSGNTSIDYKLFSKDGEYYLVMEPNGPQVYSSKTNRPVSGIEIKCTDEGVTRVRSYKCALCPGEAPGEPDPDFKNEHKASGIPANITVTIKYIDDDCTKGGTETTTDICVYCGSKFDTTKTLEPEESHDYYPADFTVDITPATCTTPELHVYSVDVECRRDGCEFHAGPDEPIEVGKALGHKWGEFEPDEGKDMTPNDNCIEKTVTGTITCNRCGEVQTTTITIPGKMDHTWGPWIPNADGKTETHTCQVPGCGKTETRDITSSGTTPSEPDEPDGPSKPDDPGTSTPDTTSYTISVSTDGHGTVTTSATSARAGTRITVTVRADDGYEVDKVRVTGNTFGTDLSGGSYSFTMPAENVTVTASFSKRASSVSDNWTGSADTSQPEQTVVQGIPQASTSERLFSDIPTTHWAAGEINWANQMGFMNGTNGRFNPNVNISRQQMWMILARLTGSNPSSMADARRWAINGGFADGSSPEASVNRHQLVTALYRCAHLMGTSNRGTTSLASFPDSRTVPAGARDAFAWAVANGIIGGNANGRLDPNGTVSRAQFAVFLYRFSQRV